MCAGACDSSFLLLSLSFPPSPLSPQAGVARPLRSRSAHRLTRHARRHASRGARGGDARERIGNAHSHHTLELCVSIAMPDAPHSPPRPLFRMRAIGRLAAHSRATRTPMAAEIRMQRPVPTACDVLYRGMPALPNPQPANKVKKTSRAAVPSPTASPFLTASLLPWSGLLVVDKPADVCIDSAPSVLPPAAAAGSETEPRSTTLESLAYEALTALEPVEAGSPAAAKIKLRPCHQLDLATSGVMVYALDSESAHRVAALFASRRTHKTYVALVHGHPASDSMMCDEPLGSMHEPAGKEFREQMGSWADPGRSAVTTIHVLERGYMRFHTADAASASAASTLSPVSLVALLPQSGRRHQLRLHTRHAGHSIVGDLAYSCPSQLAKDQVSPRMMLHAWKLQMPLDTAADEQKPPPCEGEHASSAAAASSAACDSSAAASAGATAISCTSSSGVSSITFQTRSNPFAGLLSDGTRTRFWPLHHAPHSHVLGGPRHLGSDLGGILLLAKDSQGRMCVLVTKYARSMMASHLDVKSADFVLPFAPPRRDSAASAPSPSSAASAAASAAASSSSASSSTPRLNLNGSMWSLPCLARVPNDADVADAAARSLSMFLSPLQALRGLESSGALSLAAGCDAAASSPESESFATLQLARHFRRANGDRLGVLELPSLSRPTDAPSLTIFMVHAPVAPSLLTCTANNAWLPVADLFAGIAPGAGVPSAAPPASVVPSATPLLLVRSLNRSWSVSSLLLAVMQHSSVLTWLGEVESRAAI